MTQPGTVRQVVSKQRVADHGEVYTNPREVNAMLDLVRQETERIDSRFLEPACGTGNFLTEILRRKLAVVEGRYRRSQVEYERYAVLAVSSIYGIDILHDNVVACRGRLQTIFDEAYGRLFGAAAREDCRRTAAFILARNIIHGDALTLKTVGDDPRPIVFSEWSFITRSQMQRRDFTFRELLPDESPKQAVFFSDKGDIVFIPTPLREYAAVHFLRMADVQRD